MELQRIKSVAVGDGIIFEEEVKCVVFGIDHPRRAHNRAVSVTDVIGIILAIGERNREGYDIYDTHASAEDGIANAFKHAESQSGDSAFILGYIIGADKEFERPESHVGDTASEFFYGAGFHDIINFFDAHCVIGG